MASDLEADFHKQMVAIYEQAKEMGYVANRFIEKVLEIGGVAAAKAWLSSSAPQDGLFRLWELSRLDLSMES